jgi:NAD(P)H-hydrate epimerase
MAKGGSGDVLCGILCALLAQGFEPWFSARAAVWLHGFAGDLAEGELGEYSLTPTDLIRFLPKAFRTLCVDSKN